MEQEEGIGIKVGEWRIAGVIYVDDIATINMRERRADMRKAIEDDTKKWRYTLEQNKREEIETEEKKKKKDTKELKILGEIIDNNVERGQGQIDETMNEIMGKTRQLAWMGRGREIVKMQVLKIVTEAYIGSRLEAKLRMTVLRVEDERRIISAQVGLIKEIMGLPRKTSPRGILIELGWDTGVARIEIGKLQTYNAIRTGRGGEYLKYLLEKRREQIDRDGPTGCTGEYKLLYETGLEEEWKEDGEVMQEKEWKEKSTEAVRRRDKVRLQEWREENKWYKKEIEGGEWYTTTGDRVGMALMMAMRLGVLNLKGRCKLCGAEREDIRHVMEECEDMEEEIGQKGGRRYMAQERMNKGG